VSLEFRVFSGKDQVNMWTCCSAGDIAVAKINELIGEDLKAKIEQGCGGENCNFFPSISGCSSGEESSTTTSAVAFAVPVSVPSATVVKKLMK
jgi:hypothetical protein